MNYDTKKSGSVIKELRKKCGYTQESLADELGIDRSGVGKIETGDRGCSVDLLLILSEVLDVSVDYLLNGREFVSKKKKAEMENELDETIKRLELLKKMI